MTNGYAAQGVNAYEAAFRIAEENGRQVEMISVEELKERHPEGGVIVTISGVGSPATPTAYTPPEYYPRLLELLESALTGKAGLAAVSAHGRELARQRTAAEIHAAVMALKKSLEYTQSNVSPAAVCGWLAWALR